MLEAQGRLAGAGRGAYLFDFMHSFAIEFLHWKQERVELRERRERPWATLVAVSHRTAHLGLATGLGVGWWGESWGAVMWVILEEGLCAGQEGGDVVPLDAAWGPSCPSTGDPHCSGRGHRAPSQGCGAPWGSVPPCLSQWAHCPPLGCQESCQQEGCTHLPGAGAPW